MSEPERPPPARFAANPRAARVVVALMLVSVVLYIHRAGLAFCLPFLQERLGFDDRAGGRVLGAFFLGYAFAQVPAGSIADRFGRRGALAVYLVAWSLATGLLGLASGVAGLVGWRLALGVAQAGAYPTAAGILRETVPLSVRGRASSLVALGGRLGGAIAPLLCAALFVAYTPIERSSLLVPDDLLDSRLWREQRDSAAADPLRAALAPRIPEIPDSDSPVAWADALNRAVDDPELAADVDPDDPRLAREVRALLAKTPAERTLEEIRRLNRLLLETAFPKAVRRLQGEAWRSILATLALLGLPALVVFLHATRAPRGSASPAEGAPSATATPPAPEPWPWRELLTHTRLWCVSVAEFGVNLGWAFLITLLPRYLEDAYAVPIELRGWMSTAPLAAGMIGMLTGGRVTDFCRARLGPRWGRALPMSASMFVCAIAVAGATLMQSAWGVVALLCVMAMSVDFGSPAFWSYIQDIGGKHVGAALGWGNMWGNLGAAASPVILEAARAAYGWNGAFLVAALAFLVAAAGALLANSDKPLRAGDSDSDAVAERP